MSKPLYAALPLRALCDPRMSGSHLKVLGVIAAHDRLNKNGQGCRAGNPRLAQLAGCHLKSLSRTIRELAKWGYIDASTNPCNRRSRMYTVIYTDEDAKAFGFDKPARERVDICSQSTPDDREIGNPQVTNTDAIGNPQVTQNTPIGNTQVPETIDNPLKLQREHKPNIFCETERDSVETGNTSCRNAGFSGGANGEDVPRTWKRVNRGARSIGGVVSQFAPPPTVTTLPPRENARIVGAAQQRLAGKLGPGGNLILQYVSEATLGLMTDKELTATFNENDKAIILAEAAQSQQRVLSG